MHFTCTSRLHQAIMWTYTIVSAKISIIRTRKMAIANGTCVSFCTFCLPGYARGKIAVNVTWMERGFNACQRHRNMYPFIFNRFPVIQPVSSKVRHFSTFFAHFDLPWARPFDNRGKCDMDGKRILCWSNVSQHIPIYLQPFTSYSEILVGNCNFFLPLAFNAPVGGVPIGIPGKSLVLRKLESWGY